MAPAASLQCRMMETSDGVFVLCDLTRVLEHFENSLWADQLPEMPDFVVNGTTAVLRAEAMDRQDDLKPGTASRHHDSGQTGASCSSEQSAEWGWESGWRGRKSNTPPARKPAARSL